VACGRRPAAGRSRPATRPRSRRSGRVDRDIYRDQVEILLILVDSLRPTSPTLVDRTTLADRSASRGARGDSAACRAARILGLFSSMPPVRVAPS
jgi:hypothetical protein